ncbi:MAG TPA: PAS domain S-box protein, partial [Thermoanaerobaculia bacterium]|nr:PAS domain S-box protein [Thermoanaerobaculia bacterium]
MTREPQWLHLTPHSAEELARLLIERSPGAVAMFDREMRYLAWSRRYLADYGLGERDLTGRSHYEVFPAISERLKEIHRRCLAGAVESCDEHPFLRPDGRLDLIRWEIHPWYETADRVGGIVLFSEVLTEKKYALQALQESDARFGALLRLSPIATFISSSETGKLVYVNDAACELFGYSSRELLGRTAVELGIVDPLIRRANIERSRRGEGRNLETPIFTRSGERRDTLVSLQETGFGTDRVILGFIVDVTPLKRAETSLRESEERLRLALDAAHMGTFDWDVSTNRIIWTGRHAELWGLAEEEFDGTYEAAARAVHPDDLPAVEAEIKQSIARRTPFMREFRVVRPDGSIRWITSHGSFTFDESGVPPRMRGVVVDTTERKHAELKLEETERRLRLVLDGLGPQMLAGLLDPNGVVLFANRPALEALGQDASAIVGRHAWDIFAFDLPGARERVRSAIERAARGESIRYDEQLAIPGREPFWIDMSIQPLRDEEGKVAFLVPSGLVIDERKRAERKLEETSARLRALFARVEQVREEERIAVSRQIHDDLGQLLTSLKMDVHWIERKLSDPALPAAVNPLIDRVVAASEVVDATIRSVQQIASSLRPVVLDRLGIEAALAEEARRFEERTGIRCQLVVTGRDEPLARETAGELFHICREGLTNVARHAKAGHVEIRLARERGVLTLEIVDDGVGIAETDIAASGSLGLLGMHERAALCGG